MCLGIALRVIPFILIPVHTKFLSPDDFEIIVISYHEGNNQRIQYPWTGRI